MPNFIVPVVGNPNGGFQNGDQVTAENLNAHVQDAVPTSSFIEGRQTSTEVNHNDWFMKVGTDGNLYKVRGGLLGVSPELLKVNEIKAVGGDGSTTPYGSMTFNSIGNMSIWLGAYSDPANTNSGTLSVNGNSYVFTYKQPYSQLPMNYNNFIIGSTDNRSWTRIFSETFQLDSKYVPEFVGTHGLKLPSGTTSERPSNPVDGTIRYNTETKDLEFRANSSWSGLQSSAATAIYTKQLPAMTFAAGVVLWETPNAFVVPEGEEWVYELHYQFNADNWGGNTRPEVLFTTEILKGTIPVITMVAFTGPYGGNLSAAHATVTLTRADTHLNGTDFPKKIVWKCKSTGRFGSYTDGMYAYGYVKLTKVKTASKGSVVLI